MALDANRLGTAIFNTIKSFAPAPGVTVTDTQLKDMWIAVSQDIINEVSTNGTINLAGGDIPVDPGTFVDSLAAPIAGQGASAAVALVGKIS